MMQQGNPTKRLYLILAQVQAAQKSEPSQRVWAKALNTPIDDLALLTQRVGYTMMLPNEAAAQIRTLFPTHESAVNHWLSQVTRAFSAHSLLGQVASFSEHIDVHSIRYLQSHSDLVESRGYSDGNHEDSILEYRKQLSQLLAEIVADPFLNIQLKNFVVGAIKKIVNALDEYKINGLAPILEATSAAAGIIVANEERLKGEASNPAFKKFVAGLKIFYMSVAVVSGIAKGIEYFGPKALEILEEISGPSDLTTPSRPVLTHEDTKIA